MQKIKGAYIIGTVAALAVLAVIVLLPESLRGEFVAGLGVVGFLMLIPALAANINW